MRVLPVPTQLTLYVNWACNLRCANCYLYGVGGHQPPYMQGEGARGISWEVFTAAVDPLLEHGAPLSVCLMGGEPLLHPRAPELVAHLKSRTDTYVDVNTNATMDPRRIVAVLEAGIDAVYVSIDGGSAEVNDPGRGEGSFRRALRGTQAALEWRHATGSAARVAVNYTITNLNYRSLLDTAELCEGLGLDELFVNLPTFVHRDEGESGRAELAKMGFEFESWRGFEIDQCVTGIDPSDLQAELERLGDRDWGFDLFVQPVGYDARQVSRWFTDEWRDIMRPRGCPVQSFRTTVLPNGDVTPCTVYPDVTIGNVLDRPLPELWRGERYREFRARVDGRLLETCTRCCDLYDEAATDPAAFVDGSRRRHVFGASTRA